MAVCTSAHLGWYRLPLGTQRCMLRVKKIASVICSKSTFACPRLCGILLCTSRFSIESVASFNRMSGTHFVCTYVADIIRTKPNSQGASDIEQPLTSAGSARVGDRHHVANNGIGLTHNRCEPKQYLRFLLFIFISLTQRITFHRVAT